MPYQSFQPFTSAKRASTIASILDIQFRNWYQRARSYVDDNLLQACGGFIPLRTTLLSDSYVLVEGLVVDAIDGGIGFRNHTIPHGLRLGARWSVSRISIVATSHFLVNGNGRDTKRLIRA